MCPDGSLSKAEINQQPQVWQETLETTDTRRGEIERFLTNSACSQAIFYGGGSSYYLAESAASTFQKLTGVSSRAVPSSELIFFPESILSKKGKTVLFPISRSGETTETIQATKSTKERFDAVSFGISCHPHSKLLENVDFSLALPESAEESVVMTKSYTSMLLALQRVAATYGGDEVAFRKLEELPQEGREILKKAPLLAEEILKDRNWNHFVFLGGGPLYGLASEAMLKMKEMALENSEVFHPLEYRHGPKSVAEEGSLITLLGSSTALEKEAILTEELRGLGAKIFAMAPEEEFATKLDHQLTLASTLGDHLRGILYLPCLQMLSLERALLKGLNPDEPRNLDQVVKLEDES